MPIGIHAELRRPTPDEFAELAYDVMACAFHIHKEIGRFFNEKIYKRVFARRFGGVELEVPVVVRLDGFVKLYSLDTVVRGAALFEWKSAEALAPEHRAQLLNYLLLFERHARRFLAHTELNAIHWVNITRQEVLFKTLLRQEHSRH